MSATSDTPAVRGASGAAIEKWLVAGLVFLAVAAGQMESTAIWNTSNFGIPLFWAPTALMAVTLAVACARGAHDIYIDQRALAMFLVLMTLLWGLSFLQILFGIIDPGTAMPQVIARTALLSFFLALSTYLCWRDHFLAALTGMLVFAAIYFTYGIYDFFAQIAGWPALLGFLRNSASIPPTEARGIQGWLALPRAMSLASEPSSTTLAVCLALYGLLFLWRRTRWTNTLLAIVLLFLGMTISRSVWLVAAVALIFVGMATWLNQRSRKLYNFALPWALPSFTFAIPAAYLINVTRLSSTFSDSSAAKRQATTELGMRVFAENPWIGIGPNNIGTDFWRYAEGLFDPLSKETIQIHSAHAYYLQAFGIFGLAFVFLPIIYVIALDRLSLIARLWWVLVLSIYSSSVDTYYTPEPWLILAILTAENSFRLRLESLGLPCRGRLSELIEQYRDRRG